MCFLLFFRFGSVLSLPLGQFSRRLSLSLFSSLFPPTFFSTFFHSRRHKEPKIKYFRLLHIAASGRANRFCYCFCCSIPVHWGIVVVCAVYWSAYVRTDTHIRRRLAGHSRSTVAVKIVVVIVESCSGLQKRIFRLPFPQLGKEKLQIVVYIFPEMRSL